MIDQREKVDAWCIYRSCVLVDFVEDVDKSGKDLRRAGLQEVLDRLDAGEAEVLVAAKLERLARSVFAFGELLKRSTDGGWSIVVLDFDLDTSTAAGRLVANVMMSVAQWEREAIGERTRDALAVKRGQGVVMGRPRSVPVDTVDQIRAQRGEGLSLQAIADRLNEDGVATGHGAALWGKSSVAAVLARHQDGGR